MDGEAQDLLEDLSAEARFDSRGEFEIDLARAREKLEQHLGLWPEDYLAFLIQAAYGLGARRLRLTSGWRAVIWEFDGPVLTRAQMETLLNEGRSISVSAPLERLQIAMFLLSRSRYTRYSLSSGLAGQGFKLEWKGGEAVLHPCKRRSSWANQLVLHMPLKNVSVHWLLSRTTTLFTLPEYAAVRPRFKDGPLRLVLPWSRPTRYRHEEPVVLAIALTGRQRLANECPAAAVHELRLESDTEYSLWFATHHNPSLRCLVYSLGYDGPEWHYGALWLYCDGLRTDLSQRQLVVGPRLQTLLADVEKRLGAILLETLAAPALRQDCMSWILVALTRYVNHGGLLGEALARLPLFKMAFHEDYSLKQLDALYKAQSDQLYFCTEIPRHQPQEAPPVVILEPNVATILKTRFADMRACSELFDLLEVRQDNRERWFQRKPEALEVSGVVATFPIEELEPVPGIEGRHARWKGQIGLLSSDVAPRLDVYLEGKWVASVSNFLERFPKGLTGRVEHPALKMNSSWTEPEGMIWKCFLAELWSRLPDWMAELVVNDEEKQPWLLDRAYNLVLAHRNAEPLERLPLVPVGEGRRSVEDCRKALADQTLQHWILDGWLPRDRAWQLVNTLLAHDDELKRHWRMRLEIYQKGYENWKASPLRPIALPNKGELICWVPLGPDIPGEIGLRTLKTNTVQVFSYRQGRRLGVNTLPGLPCALGGLPECLVVAVEHPGLLPNGDWTEAVLDGPAWFEALQWIWKRLPDLLRPLMLSGYADKSLLAVRLLAWLPRSVWPLLEAPGPFCKRLDGEDITLDEAMVALESGPPVKVLVEPGDVRCFEGFETVWLLTKPLASELRSIWGPSRLEDVQGDYLAAMLALEHGQREKEEAVLPAAPWLQIQNLEHGQVGLRLQPGPANRCRLRLLRRGHLLLEHNWPLCAGPEHTSHYRLEAVVEWPEAPVVGEFQRLWEEPDSRQWLEELHGQLRLFGFYPPVPAREFLWERLAYEAGAREAANVGFTLELDAVRLKLLKLPLFPLEGRNWTLEEVYRYLTEESRLGYVLGDPIEVGAGPILYLTARELHWLKLLLGHSRLANLSHLRKALKQQQQAAESPLLEELPLPDLDYLVVHREEDRCWGLQREVNGPSRLRVLRGMRVVDALSYDWRYQVQASLNLDNLHLNADGTVRRDQDFQKAIDELRVQIHQAIVSETPPRYRLEVGLWSWGVQEEWAEALHLQPLLRDARGQIVSLRQWVDAWERDEGRLPYLLEEEAPGDDQLDLLPDRPVPLLPAVLVTVASRMMRGLMDYREGLRLAWQWIHQAPAPPAPAASYSAEHGDLLVVAEYHWIEQHLVVRWRGRVIHQQSRRQWPGYIVEVNFSQRLLGQPWPVWAEVAVGLSPYWRHLHKLLQQSELLEADLESWEALPVDPSPGPIPTYFDPTEDDLRLLLARRKAEWRGRARGLYAPVQVVCEHWWGCPVEIDIEAGDWPLRAVEVDGQRRLYLNPQHRWFRGRSPEVIAMRVCLWLQGAATSRESVARCNAALEALGALEQTS